MGVFFGNKVTVRHSSAGLVITQIFRYKSSVGSNTKPGTAIIESKSGVCLDKFSTDGPLDKAYPESCYGFGIRRHSRKHQHDDEGKQQ